MGYRDEKEQLRVRVEKLESELGEAHETIARLTGVASAPETGVKETRNPLLDAPRFVQLERELDLEISEEGLEAIAELIRSRTNQQVQQVGRTLKAPGLSLTQEGGRARISMFEDYQGANAGALMGSVGAGLFGSMVAFAIWHDLINRALAEANFLWLAPIGVGLAFVAFRKIFQSKTRTRARELRATFEAVVELAHRHRVDGEQKMRVEVPADEFEEEEEEEEEEVVEEAASALEDDA